MEACVNSVKIVEEAGRVKRVKCEKAVDNGVWQGDHCEDNCQDIRQSVEIMTWPAQVMTPTTLPDDI